MTQPTNLGDILYVQRRTIFSSRSQERNIPKTGIYGLYNLCRDESGLHVVAVDENETPQGLGKSIVDKLCGSSDNYFDRAEQGVPINISFKQPAEFPEIHRGKGETVSRFHNLVEGDIESVLQGFKEGYMNVANQAAAGVGLYL